MTIQDTATTTVPVVVAESPSDANALDGAPIAVAVAVATPAQTVATDVESQLLTPTIIVEPIPHPTETGAENSGIIVHREEPQLDPDAGKGCGIAMLIVLIIGGACWYVVPVITIICVPIAIVISCIMHCGCCCFNNTYRRGEMALNVHAFVFTAMLALSTIAIIWGIIVYTWAFRSYTSSWRPSQIAMICLYVVAIISTALSVWGRSLCAPRNENC
mmetsp:Transcript_5071/g.11041  ORF Transcript_5071/g.11041 Transcript_5071/m.11041 type:complete len:217 (+) Transcript_5071:211-861(+)